MFVVSYEKAKHEKLSIPKIYPHQFTILNDVLDHIETETEFANTVINMLLVNVRQSDINPAEYKICSILSCVKEALDRYPLSSNERKLIQYRNNRDFLFHGSELLTVHVLFNLIKNSLYYLMSAGKGHIEIWISENDKNNSLYFRDTGTGIDADILPHIFNQFYSKTYHGYGVGLAFCKMVMRSYGGDIICRSKKGEFTEFSLNFPKVNN